MFLCGWPEAVDSHAIINTQIEELIRLGCSPYLFCQSKDKRNLTK